MKRVWGVKGLGGGGGGGGVKSRPIKRSLPLALLLPQQLPGGFPGCWGKLKCCRPLKLTFFFLFARLSSSCRYVALLGTNILMVVRSTSSTRLKTLFKHGLSFVFFLHSLWTSLYLFHSFFFFLPTAACPSSFFFSLPPLSPFLSLSVSFSFISYPQSEWIPAEEWHLENLALLLLSHHWG